MLRKPNVTQVTGKEYVNVMGSHLHSCCFVEDTGHIIPLPEGQYI